jgi:hypothetical protein
VLVQQKTKHKQFLAYLLLPPHVFSCCQPPQPSCYDKIIPAENKAQAMQSNHLLHAHLLLLPPSLAAAPSPSTALQS